MIEQSQNGQAISNVFSEDGKRLQRSYPGGRTLTATFDELDRRTRISNAGGTIAECLYIGPGGRELKRLNANGTSLTFLDDGDSEVIGYDGVQRITGLRHKLPGGQAFIDRSFEYNRTSMRTCDTRNDDSGQQNKYSYDSVYRVVDARYDVNGSGGVQRDRSQQSFDFDGVGNRRNVQEVSQSQGVSNEAYSVNAMNEYSSVRGVTRNHDDNGNLIDDGEFLFVYDAKDRLVRVFNKGSGNLVADYLYDCGNRRTKKIVYSQSNPGQVEKETKFLYDGWEVCEEQNSSGQTEITYVYGNGIDEILEFTRTANHPLGAGQFFCHQDIQKNVVAITDASGALVEKTFFDAYGAALDSNKQSRSLSGVGNPYGFQGRRLDAETGLYYFRHRYYDPETGRFIQRDPVWDANNVGNQYSFANANIINGMDPMGLFDVAGDGVGFDPREDMSKSEKQKLMYAQLGVAASYAVYAAYAAVSFTSTGVTLGNLGRATGTALLDSVTGGMSATAILYGGLGIMGKIGGGFWKLGKGVVGLGKKTVMKLGSGIKNAAVGLGGYVKGTATSAGGYLKGKLSSGWGKVSGYFGRSAPKRPYSFGDPAGMSKYLPMELADDFVDAAGHNLQNFPGGTNKFCSTSSIAVEFSARNEKVTLPVLNSVTNADEIVETVLGTQLPTGGKLTGFMGIGPNLVRKAKGQSQRFLMFGHPLQEGKAAHVFTAWIKDGIITYLESNVPAGKIPPMRIGIVKLNSKYSGFSYVRIDNLPSDKLHAIVDAFKKACGQ